MGRVKGTAVKSFINFIKEKGGEAGTAELVRSCPSEQAELLTKPILPVGWYDFGDVIGLLLEADRAFAQGDKKLLYEAGVYNARQDLRGLYRFFIKAASPQFIINNSARVWKQYYDKGEMAVAYQKPKRGALKMTGFPDIPLGHDIEQLGYMEEAFRMSGGKGIRGSHPKCQARGDDCCLYEFTWE